jgi:hypothetical protein
MDGAVLWMLVSLEASHSFRFIYQQRRDFQLSLDIRYLYSRVGPWESASSPDLQVLS